MRRRPRIIFTPLGGDQVKKDIIAVELNRGLAAEEIGRLQPELAETPKLIADNEKAIAAARVGL